jgi:hypothetical protein
MHGSFSLARVRSAVSRRIDTNVLVYYHAMMTSCSYSTNFIAAVQISCASCVTKCTRRIRGTLVRRSSARTRRRESSAIHEFQTFQQSKERMPTQTRKKSEPATVPLLLAPTRYVPRNGALQGLAVGCTQMDKSIVKARACSTAGYFFFSKKLEHCIILTLLFT